MLHTVGAASLVGLGALCVPGKEARAANAIVLAPEQTEGPYWVDEMLNRSDIRVDPTDGSVQPGLLTVLDLTVGQVTGSVAAPLVGAAVDIWHASASGLYSDEASENTVGSRYLRGYQVTDRRGRVRFTTVFPGWYSGRTPHIHCRVRLFSGTTTTYNFTTQFFFDEAVTAAVYALAPYSARPGRDTTNTTDNIYQATDCITGAVDGTELTLAVAAGSSRVVASYGMLLDLSQTSACVADGGPEGGGAPGGGAPPGGMAPGATPPSDAPPGGMPAGGTPPT